MWWDEVPVGREEAEWLRQVQIAASRAPEGWNGVELPSHKPAFATFLPAASGEVWVLRFGPSVRLPECPDAFPASLDELFNRGPCWQPTFMLDAFDSSGRYLGPIELPEGIFTFETRLYLPWIDGDRLFAAAVDDSGTIRMKRYRLVPPTKR